MACEQLASYLPAADQQLKSCLPNSTRAAYEQHTSYYQTAQGLLGSSLAAPPANRLARAERAAPKGLRSTTECCQTAREPCADPQSASEAARGQFASTLGPLRLRTLRPPALKIDSPSKYRILPYVSKQGL